MGVLDDYILALEDQIANSARFQTEVGAANATEAKDRIYWHKTLGAEDVPFALIMPTADWQGDQVALGLVLYPATSTVRFAIGIELDQVNSAGEIEDWKTVASALADYASTVSREMQARGQSQGLGIRTATLAQEAQYEVIRERKLLKKQTKAVYAWQDVAFTSGVDVQS